MVWAEGALDDKGLRSIVAHLRSIPKDVESFIVGVVVVFVRDFSGFCVPGLQYQDCAIFTSRPGCLTTPLGKFVTNLYVAGLLNVTTIFVALGREANLIVDEACPDHAPKSRFF